MSSPNPESLNAALVDRLVENQHISSPAVESAFRTVMRQHFVPGIPLEDVYSDRSIGTKHINDRLVSSSSQPAIMAVMLEQLDLRPGHRVLEIGTGTGYNAALLSHVVGSSGRVFTMDIDPDIVDDARRHLDSAGCNDVVTLCGDGGFGYVEASPYDRIILTVAADDILPAWWAQLRRKGRLVLPLELRTGQQSVAFVNEPDCMVSHSVRGCGFIRLRGAFASEATEPIIIGDKPSITFIAGQPGTKQPDAERIYGWLSSNHPTIETNIWSTIQENWEGINKWITLQEPLACQLIAVGEAAESDFLPALNRFRESGYITTVGLATNEGMALLEHSHLGGEPAQLLVHCYGDGGSLADQLLRIIHDWDRKLRPSASDLVIRALPIDREISDPSAIIIEKKWSKFLLTYG